VPLASGARWGRQERKDQQDLRDLRALLARKDPPAQPVSVESLDHRGLQVRLDRRGLRVLKASLDPPRVFVS
jgi:hypothetical protein